MQKVASVKGPRKTERKGATNKIENGQWQKKSRFWLMRMPGIEILLNFVPNPRKISPFSKKKSFLAELRLI